MSNSASQWSERKYVPSVGWIVLGTVFRMTKSMILKKTLREEQLNNENVHRYVPNNIQPGMFVTFVYDNCDHNSESIYNVILYGTNEIVLQAM